MRTLAAVVRCVPLLSLLSGCGDCWSTFVTTRCSVAGDLEGTSADGTTYDNHSPRQEASCPTVSFGGRGYSGGARPASSPQDLNIGLIFHAPATTDPSTTTAGRAVDVTLKMTVRDVPLGASEIDLDDTRASLAGWSGLHGHISVSDLSQNCSRGQDYCLLAVHAMFSVSASGPDGTLSLTGVTLDAQDWYERVMTMCAVIGE
jgi:hypothetical protein